MMDRFERSQDRAQHTPETVEHPAPDLSNLAELRQGVLTILRVELRDRILAEDLCNEAFRIVIERLQHTPLEQPEKLPAFLAQTARNLATAERRKAARRRTDTGQSDAIGRQAAEEPEAAHHLQAPQRARAVRRVLEELRSARDRELLVRYYLRDDDKEDICRDLELTEEHFNRVIFRARERFRVLLERRYRRDDLLCLVL